MQFSVIKLNKVKQNTWGVLWTPQVFIKLHTLRHKQLVLQTICTNKPVQQAEIEHCCISHPFSVCLPLCNKIQRKHRIFCWWNWQRDAENHWISSLWLVLSCHSCIKTYWAVAKLSSDKVPNCQHHGRWQMNCHEKHVHCDRVADRHQVQQHHCNIQSHIKQNCISLIECVRVSSTTFT